MSKVAALLMLVGCGRIGFNVVGITGDAVDSAGSDASGGDGPPAVSCGTLASTCGPTGTSPCCDSPVVLGGTYARSYDVSGDGMRNPVATTRPSRRWPSSSAT